MRAMARRAKWRCGVVGVWRWASLSYFGPRGAWSEEHRAARDDDAQILFFTGVRYQRASDPVAPAGESDSSAPPSGGIGGAGGGRRKRRG